MILKDTSVIPEFSGPILLAIMAANEVAALQGANLILTDGKRPLSDGRSKHEDSPSNAVDIRRRNLNDPEGFCADLFERLGERGDPYDSGIYRVWRGQQYDVLISDINIHVEYDPK